MFLSKHERITNDAYIAPAPYCDPSCRLAQIRAT